VPFTDVLARAPDPELARVALSRVRDAGAHVSDDDVALVRLLGFSRAASDFLVRHPDEAWAIADAASRTHHAREAERGADVGRLGGLGGVRRFRRRAMLRIAARDLAGAELEDVVAEVSAVAEACLRFACASVDARLAVIGLGKLGGAELNYASDVDLLFVRSSGPDEDAIGSILRILSEPTEDGVGLRVDPTLRPGGRAAPLSRSLEATLAYYERESATWERQALIKARPVAGDPDLGAAFLDGVQTFVYPAHLEPSAIDEVRRTKVRLEEYIRRRGKELTEVKRGRGGIRDVEFAVQLLQIVHGRRNEALRSTNTLEALRALAAEGYVANEDAHALADAYRFLRRLEHRLQMVRDLPIHELPSDEHQRLTIARSLGLPDTSALRSEYDRTTDLVRGLHERLFYRPLLEAFAGAAAPTPGVGRAATEELLHGLGFGETSRSYEVLARLVDSGSRFGKVLRHVFPVMAPALALAADPDAALVRLERVAAAVGDRHGPADTLATDPSAARHLGHVVAASSFATDLLVADPERVGALADQPPEAADAAADLVRVVGVSAGRDLLPHETGAAIAAVADRVVREALVTAAPELPFAAIGMGKLGARELQFASDLDLVFVYEGEGPEDLRRAVEAAERTMRAIRDAGWDPDADLRPEGRSGPLARSLAGYLDYWQRYAETWEFQSLLRARFVAGDAALGRRFELNARDVAYPADGITLDHAEEIRRMRERIELERVRPPDASRFHLKLGRGSLADVQFAVEVSLMRHGGRNPAVRTAGTLDAIERLADAKLLEQSVARDLGEAFVFLCDVKNALEVDRRVHAEAIPSTPDEQTALARRLGYEEYPRQSFLHEYLRITRRCRRAMERVFRQEAD